jgi:hypothetical protein
MSPENQATKIWQVDDIISLAQKIKEFKSLIEEHKSLLIAHAQLKVDYGTLKSHHDQIITNGSHCSCTLNLCDKIKQEAANENDQVCYSYFS